MSRGPGPLQRELLSRVKLLKPGQQFALSELVGANATDDQWDSARRAARRLAGEGLIRLDGERRGLVVRPPGDRPKPDTSKFADVPVSDIYPLPATPATQGSDKCRVDGLSVGLSPAEAQLVLDVADLTLGLRGLLSQSERERLSRLRDRLQREGKG